MSWSQVAALAICVVLMGVLFGLVTETGPEPVVSAAEETLIHDMSSTTTTIDAYGAVLAGSNPLSAEELELTEEAISRVGTTTTTTLPPETTTTTAAPQSSPTTQPKSNPPTTAAPAPAPAPSNEAGYRAEMEADFYGRINAIRQANGLGALSRNGSLASRARDWARAMAEAGELSHSNLSSLVPPWSAAGENVGKGGSVKSIFGLLKNSSGHLHNMLGDYTQVGVGVWEDSQGVLWTCHVFTR